MTRVPSETVVSCETVLIGASKTKEGIVIRLAIHPNDLPDLLMRVPVGTRFMAALSLIGDDEKSQDEIDGERAVKLAAVLCKDPDFIEMAERMQRAPFMTPGDVEEWMRRQLGVRSRAELKTDKAARERLRKMQEELDLWRNYR